MKELENKLDVILDKYKKEYASICEPENGFNLSVKADNVGKFTPINEKFIDESLACLNEHLKNIEDKDYVEKSTTLLQDYIKSFQIQAINPFS